MTVGTTIVAVFPPVFGNKHNADLGRKSVAVSVENERGSVEWRRGNGSAWKGRYDPAGLCRYVLDFISILGQVYNASPPLVDGSRLPVTASQFSAVLKSFLEFSTARLQLLLKVGCRSRRPPDYPGMSRMQQLPPGAVGISRSRAPQGIFPAIVQFPPLPALYTPHPLRLPPLYLAFPRHASLPLFFQMAQAAVKGKAPLTKVNQQVSSFSIPFSHPVVCERCPKNPFCVDSIAGGPFICRSKRMTFRSDTALKSTFTSVRLTVLTTSTGLNILLWPISERLCRWISHTSLKKFGNSSSAK